MPGAIAAAGGPPVSSPVNGRFAGVCSQPLAHVPGISAGGAPLVGAGYVGGPPGPYNINNHPGTAYLGTSAPRLYYGSAAAQTGNYDTTYSNGPDFARSDIFGFSLTGEYAFSNDLRLKSISAYRQIRWNIGTPQGGTPAMLSVMTDSQHQWQVSQEIQLLGKSFNDKLNWVGGLYYFQESGCVHGFVGFENILQVRPVPTCSEKNQLVAVVIRF